AVDAEGVDDDAWLVAAQRDAEEADGAVADEADLQLMRTVGHLEGGVAGQRHPASGAHALHALAVDEDVEVAAVGALEVVDVEGADAGADLAPRLGAHDAVGARLAALDRHAGE